MSQCTKTGTPTGKFMWLNIQIKYGTYVSGKNILLLHESGKFEKKHIAYQSNWYGSL